MHQDRPNFLQSEIDRLKSYESSASDLSKSIDPDDWLRREGFIAPVPSHSDGMGGYIYDHYQITEKGIRFLMEYRRNEEMEKKTRRDVSIAKCISIISLLVAISSSIGQWFTVLTK